MGLFADITRPWREVPTSCLNWTLFAAIWTFGLSGTMGGLDDGTISGIIVLPAYVSRFHLSTAYMSATQLANVKGNIISLAQIGAMIGSLFTFLVLEKLGRRTGLRILCLVNIAGSLIQITTKTSIAQIYVGRIFLGVASGMGGVISPTYIAEVAPKSIRGACGLCYGGSYFIGLIVGYFANYGTAEYISNTNAAQWQIPLGLTFIFPTIVLVSSIWAPESPRWLIKTGKEARALGTFQRLRGFPLDHPYVVAEVAGVKHQLEREREATDGRGAWAPLRELFGISSMRYRLLLAFGLGAMGQWGGGGAFTAYAPELFQLLGVSGNTGLFTTGIYGIVKISYLKLVVSLICGIFVLDRMGRKQALYGGIALQILAALYIAIYLSITANTAEGATSADEKRAGVGAVAMVFIQGTSWALGWNAVQHPINAELFPLRLRAIGTSLAVCFRTLMNFGANKALPSMLVSIQGSGTFYFFAAEGILALGFVWFFLPDTKGRALEELDALFDLPWYQIGRAGRRVADAEGLGLIDLSQTSDHQGKNPAQNNVDTKNETLGDKPVCTQVEVV